MPKRQTHWSPDVNGAGLFKDPLNPLRYDGHTDDPNEVAGILRAMMPEKAKVLDVGCGTGSVTLIANQGKHNDILGVEPDPQRAELARSRGVNVCSGVLDQEFVREYGPFDVVIFADVLEHLASPDELLTVAIGALKAGGFILVSVPNVAHWSVRMNLLLGRFDYTETGIYDATHLRWFTQQSVRELLQRHELEILSVRHSVGALLPVYRSGLFQLIPSRVRRRFAQAGTKILPRLFGCQFVIKARKPTSLPSKPTVTV